MEDEGRLTVSSDFGNLLRRHRLAAGLSQEALAERARMSSDGISALERGLRRTPQRETLALLIGALALDDEQREQFEATARSGPGYRSGASVTLGPWPEALTATLPLALTSFIGRDLELAELTGLVRSHRFVTITGAGGIGKTQAALHVASGLENDDAATVVFVALAPVAEDSRIVPAIAAALGVQDVPQHPLLDTVRTFLRKKKLLLVIDNAEHLIGEAARVAEILLLGAPGLRILATSRTAFKASGERIYRLPSLALDHAMELFADRAKAVDFRFTITDQNAHAVADICRRLDGIPLAIELAAARAGALSVGAIAAHLDDRLRILTGGSRTSAARQQTMRAAIEWSYNLLSKSERLVFERLSIFAGGGTLAAATVVCARGDIAQASGLASAVGSDGCEDESETLEILASLVDKSLVIVEVESNDQRYRILEPIREYAWEKLVEAGELSHSQGLHATAMASLAAQSYDEWDRGPAADWLGRLDRDLANLRAALRWSVHQGNDPMLGARLVADATIIFLRLSLSAEGIEWCERIARLPALPLQVEARLRYGMSMLFSNLGFEKKCLDEALIALPLYRQTGDDRGVARALSQIASRYASQERPGEAKEAAEEALELARKSGDRRLLADVLRRCAAAFEGDGTNAVRSCYEESIALFRSLGREDDTARALAWWGQWEGLSENYTDAIERLLEAAELDSRDAATMFYGVDIASCYLAIGDGGRAEPYARKALAAAVKARYDVGASLAIAYLSAIIGERDPLKAARLLGYAQARLRENNWDFDAHDAATMEKLRDVLRKRFGEDELLRTIAAGGDLTESQAVALALSA